MKHQFFFLSFLISMSLSAMGQVNVQSPIATDFIKYGRVPVSYFNGLPQIEIPIYNAQGRNLDVPIKLRYHASGIKVDQHPTWVGLGWNLDVGGVISRVVNGIPDESNRADIYRRMGQYGSYDYYGYYYTSNFLAPADWNLRPGFDRYHGDLVDAKQYLDGEPDEFIVNGQGLSASFYFYRDNAGNLQHHIKSNNGETFKVTTPVTVSYRSFLFANRPALPWPDIETETNNVFYRFEIVKNDGTRLVFGGHDNAIEFYSVKEKHAVSSSHYLNSVPSSWFLTQIIHPTGEKVDLAYQRNGNPIVVSDVDYETRIYSFESQQLFCYGCQGPYRSFSFNILHPVYLSEITFDNNLKIEFDISQTSDLPKVTGAHSNYLNDMFMATLPYERNFVNSIYEAENYWMRLNTINVKDARNNEVLRSIRFVYTDVVTERLKLDAVEVRNKDNQAVEKYSLFYSTDKLPVYNSKQTDAWGYYNGKFYGTTDFGDMLTFRTVDLNLVKAESLTRIKYPTGGSTSFEYEAHEYAKRATQFPDFNVVNANGRAGGLRVTKILDQVADGGGQTNVRTFTYKKNNVSTGILSGVPLYKAEGRSHVQYTVSTFQNLFYLRQSVNYEQRYMTLSQRHINVLGETNGNHVTYSAVVETFGDGSRTEYSYSNHDTAPDLPPDNLFTNIDDLTLVGPFTSRALERGQLLHEDLYNSNGNPVQKDSYVYNDDPARYNSFIKVMERHHLSGLSAIPFLRYSATRIFTFHPYLKEKTTVVYDVNDVNKKVSTRETYAYNQNRQLRQKVLYGSSSQDVIRTEFRYPQDYTAGTTSAMSKHVLRDMVSRNIISLPVEKTVFRNNQVVGSTLLEHEKFGSLIAPARQSTLELLSPTSLFFNAHILADGNTEVLEKDAGYILERRFDSYDSFGNVSGISDANGLHTAYKWQPADRFPVVEISNAKNTVAVNGQVPYVVPVPVIFSTGTFNTHVFTLTETGSITLDLILRAGTQPTGRARVDFTLTGPINRSGSICANRNTDLGCTATRDVDFLPAGTYTLKITADEWSTGHTADVNLTYMKTQLITPANLEFFYNGFEESTTSGTLTAYCGVGYHNNGSYVVPFTRPNGRTYVVDYRYYLNGEWVYERKPYVNNMTLSGGTAIDEVRVYPSDAPMVTRTMDPFLGVTSQMDASGRATRYDYDNFGRLWRLRDQHDHVIEEYKYNFRP